MPADVDVEQFLKDNFRSIWALELLLHLERQAERGFTPAELIDALRASRAIVEQSLAGLIAGGLIVLEDDDRVRYAPANPRLRQAIELARDAYVSRPDAVRRIIVSGSAGSASAFADAFRLRKD